MPDNHDDQTQHLLSRLIGHLRKEVYRIFFWMVIGAALFHLFVADWIFKRDRLTPDMSSALESVLEGFDERAEATMRELSDAHSEALTTLATSAEGLKQELKNLGGEIKKLTDHAEQANEHAKQAADSIKQMQQFREENRAEETLAAPAAAENDDREIEEGIEK